MLVPSVAGTISAHPGPCWWRHGRMRPTAPSRSNGQAVKSVHGSLPVMGRRGVRHGPSRPKRPAGARCIRCRPAFHEHHALPGGLRPGGDGSCVCGQLLQGTNPESGRRGSGKISSQTFTGNHLPLHRLYQHSCAPFHRWASAARHD